VVTYTYLCPSCDHTEQLPHRMTENPQVTCERCVAPMLRKIYPVPSHFKGGGWASDNYHKEK